MAFIRNRLLLATAAALLVALIGGYLVAQALSRRVRRVEQAARAGGGRHFIEPLPVDSKDELGQLTLAFNKMQVQLRQVDVARKEFVATASHELRTPIFSLGGFLELLRDEDLDEDTRREFLDTAVEQTERLQKLAVDLLDLSRLDAGSIQLHRQGVDLSALALEVLGEFRPAVQRHDTHVEMSLPARVRATCDRERVAQIMRILLDNALRHTPEGTHVTVSAGRSGSAISLTMADDGPGLRDRGQVFERFYTGDATRGAGLGLAIARELAEHMEGTLRADSNGRGAAFTLRLPAVPGAPGRVRARLAAAGRRLRRGCGVRGLHAWRRRRRRQLAARCANHQGAGGGGPRPARRAGRRGPVPAPRPGRGHGDLGLRRRPARRLAVTAARAARARASSWTVTATWPPTRTWSPRASRQARARPSACSWSSRTPTGCRPGSWATT